MSARSLLPSTKPRPKMLLPMCYSSINSSILYNNFNYVFKIEYCSIQPASSSTSTNPEKNKKQPQISIPIPIPFPKPPTTATKQLNRFARPNPSEMGVLDLEKHFAFYGAYHSNRTNVFIHILFVWPIVFTALILLYFTPPLFSSPSLLPSVLTLNYGFVSTVIYALFYAALDIKAGSLAALLTFLCWLGSSFVANSLGFSLAWKVAVAAQLFCWTGQFIGHGVFEKRAPALLDNLVQAFLMAPFFVLLEVLQSSFGYEPYPGFQSRVNAKIEADIKQWQDKKQKKLS